MKYSLTLIALLLARCFLFASADLSGRWTNGYQEYTAARFNDSTWNFNGANLHEGGYRFLLKATSDSVFLEMRPDDDVVAPNKKTGRHVVYRVVEGQRLLLFYSKTNTIESIFTIMEEGKELEDIVCGMKTAFELAGKYLELSTNKDVIFYPTRPEAAGLLSGTDVYYFETSYDFPTNIITFKNNVHFWYVTTDSSLELYELKGNPDDEDSWAKGRKLRTLKRTGWMDQTRGKQPGRYGFASTIVVTPVILSYFSAEQRRIMRNEIYARHGYIFKSPDMQAYFAAQPWYKPVDGSGEGQLSELEKLNARTIADHPAPIPQ